MAEIKLIEAAGTVVLRQVTHSEEPEVLLVHRPRYDDWSLPKGKLEKREYLPTCALRETLEETGVLVRLQMPLDQVNYELGAGAKSVSFWRGEIVRVSPRTPDAEIDKLRWLPVSKAIAKVSYPEDPGLIKQALDLPETTPLLIVRHAKALPRKEWDYLDDLRPLNTRGSRQSVQLATLFAAYGVRRLVSSSSVRCVRSVEPFANMQQLRVENESALTEERAEKDPDQVVTLMEQLVDQTITSGVPTVVCGHRPVLPAMLEAVGVPAKKMRPGTAVVAHLDRSGETVAVEWHSPLD